MNIVLASRRKYMRKRTNPEGAPASIEDCIVSLVRDSFPYTGQAITPQVTVTTQDGVPLVVNIDYFVSYSDNVNVGAGVVIVTGTGEFVGSVVKTFQITSAAPKEDWDFDLSKTTLVRNEVLTKAYGDFGFRQMSFVEESNKIVLVNEYVNWCVNLGTGMSIDGLTETDGVKKLADYETFCGFSKNGDFALTAKSETGSLILRTREAAIPFDVESIQSAYSNSTGLSALGIGNVSFSSDGFHVFLSDRAGSFNVGIASRSGLVRFDLETPFDITTATKSQFLDVALLDLGKTHGEALTFNNAFISPNGGVVIIVLNREIFMFRLETPFDLNSRIEFVSFIETYNSFSIGILRNMFVNNDGTKAVIVNGSKVIAELALHK